MTRTTAPHRTHRMTRWETAVRAPAGTPRFYRVRSCKRCGEEEAIHVAGHFRGGLDKPCRAGASRSDDGSGKGGGTP